MAEFTVFTKDRILIGIDVGWSLKRRTCAMAIQGVRLERTFTKYYANHDDKLKNICVSLFTLKELTAFLPHFLQQLQGNVQQIIVVVDGPIGPNGPPEQNRQVDQACVRGGFRGRAQPSPVEGEMGRTYVAATYDLIRPFLAAAKSTRPWLGGTMPSGGLVVAETHPTVAMALMLPPQEPALLPTRKRSIQVDGDSIRAKSDWYWRAGVNKQVARILGSKALTEESNHERVAGLFCLAMAAQLGNESADSSTAIAIGGADGVYVVSQILDVGWQADVRRVGVMCGSPKFETTATSDFMNEPITFIEVPLVDDGDADPDEYGKGDDPLPLELRDTSVWENHNDWLIGLEPKIVLKALNGDGEEIVLVKSAGSAKQWKIDSVPGALGLARARGLSAGQHLSLENAVVIPVRIVQPGEISS